MGVPTSEGGYTSATTGRGDHEVNKGHVLALKIKYLALSSFYILSVAYYSKNSKKFEQHSIIWVHFIFQQQLDAVSPNCGDSSSFLDFIFNPKLTLK
jgi:hypothetical protein